MLIKNKPAKMPHSIFFHIKKTKIKKRDKREIFAGMLALGQAEVGCRRVGCKQ